MAHYCSQSAPTTHLGSFDRLYTLVSPSATVRHLGVFIDQDLTMKTHVQRTAASRCCATLPSVTEHSFLHTDSSLPIPRFCTRPQPLGLLQQSPHGWWSCVVVSVLASINEVNQRRAWLVLRWVTVSGFNSRCRTFISVCNQPATQGQLNLPFLWGRQISTSFG